MTVVCFVVGMLFELCCSDACFAHVLTPVSIVVGMQNGIGHVQASCFVVNRWSERVEW